MAAAAVHALPIDSQSKAKEALELYDGLGIDVLVNNGGVSTRSMARSSSFDVDTFVTDV